METKIEEYKSGEVRFCDCLDEDKGLPSLDTDSFDCIITSPPYWKGFEYEAYFNSYAQYLRWCERWMKECKRILNTDGYFWLNVINDSEITVRAYEILRIATEKLMYKLHDTIVWFRYNQQPANTNRQLTNQIEFIFLLRHSSNNINLNKELAYQYNPHIFETKNVGNVWKFPFKSNQDKSFGRKEVESKWGHSGFPKVLPQTCALLSTKKGDKVLDPFIGSGTTGVVCEELGLEWLGYEIMEDYKNCIDSRMKNTKLKKRGFKKLESWF